MATECFNKMCRYDVVIFGKKIIDIANGAHHALSIASGWDYKPLQPGSFGIDNMVCSCYEALKVLKNGNGNIIIETVADAVHRGWVINYLFWRDNEVVAPYKKPYNKLGDERRDQCAQLAYKDLNDDEKHKDIIIAQFLMQLSTSKD